jgi:hypothetical protein
MKLGKNRERQIEELEQARLSRVPLRTVPVEDLLRGAPARSAVQPGAHE